MCMHRARDAHWQSTDQATHIRRMPDLYRKHITLPEVEEVPPEEEEPP